MKAVYRNNSVIVQSLPGELAREAWKTEKLMRAYEARKKLEMMGAMMFSSPDRQQHRGSIFKKLLATDVSFKRVKVYVWSLPMRMKARPMQKVRT